MTTLEITKGDITKINTDAIVNAANSDLAGGGGVDGAIHNAAGKVQLDKACEKLNGCKTGDAKITPAFNLPSKYIIHTVGPIWHGGNNNEPQLLKNSYANSLKQAVQNHCKTVAFPSISTGVYGYPIDQAAKIAVNTIKSFDSNLKVTFVCFDDVTYQNYIKANQ